MEASLATILAQLQLIHKGIDDIRDTQAFHGDCLNHLTDEMCQMNTWIGCIARHQSRLGGFAPSPKCESSVNPYASRDDDDDDASGSAHDDQMTTSQ